MLADQRLPLRIWALGPPEVRLGDNLVTFPTRKTLALLIYLAIESGAQPREILGALLWPEANPERSYANLRNTLGHLQTTLGQVRGQAGSSYLSVTNNSLDLNPDADVDFDLRTIEQAYLLARGDRSSRTLPESSTSLPILQAAAACQRGLFLAGFSLGDAPGFDDWVAVQREIWHRRLGLVLDRLSEIQFARGEFASATDTASRWIALDALNEVAYRRKMRAHFSAGERGQALETYAACHATLADELGIEPDPDTAGLAERIRTQARPLHAHLRRSIPQPRRSDTSLAFLGDLFTGRTSEYQVLVDSFERAAASQPQLVVLRGEAGIGKTRLARKFLAWAGVRGAEVLQGGAFESGSHLPFQPLIDALRLRLDHENSPKEFLGDVWWPPLSRLLPELRQRDPGLPPALEERLDPGAQLIQAELYEPLLQFTLLLAGQAPLVLFVDDLQWTDSATLDFLQYAIRRWRGSALGSSSTGLSSSVPPSMGGRILLLVSLRSEALHPMTQPQPGGEFPGGPTGLIQWLASVGRELTPTHLELGPLAEQETVEMVRSILAPPAPDFAQWLYVESRGQPFYLMETLRDLLERRVLKPKRRAEGRWTFAVDAEHDLGKAVRVPSTVQAVIRSRLNRLSPIAFSLLSAGAVLEHQITFEHLCAITNVGDDPALPALDELISGRLLLEGTQPDFANVYTFTNDMLRDVVYTEAGDARRRLFHRRALEVLEAEGDSAAVLAHHAIAAGLSQPAFRYSLAAGQEALCISALSESIVHFEHARQILQEVSPAEMPGKIEINDLYLQLSKAYESDGQTEKVLALQAEREKLLGE